MNAKTHVTAADLFVLLDREFRRRKTRDCAGCFVQLPYRVETRGTDECNWEIVTPQECGHGCSALFDDLVAEFQRLYDLKTEPGLERT